MKKILASRSASTLKCPPGYISGAGASECTPCPAGHECPTTDQPANPCADGQYATGGAISCMNCPAGYACPNKSSNALIACSPGWYSEAMKTQCTPCTAGL